MKSAGSPMVSLIIPAYNAAADYRQCLDSIYAQSFLDFEVIWIDSNSSDDSPSMVAQEYPQVRVQRLPHNAGYRGGVKAGAELASGEYLVICNQDVEIEKEWLKELLFGFETDPKVAAVAPLILLFDKRDRVNEAGNTFHFSGLYGSRGLNDKAESYKQIEEIGTVSGCAFAIKSSVWRELGGFSDDFDSHPTGFHAGVEDLDLCWRARMLGYRIILNPRAVMYHKYERKGWHGARLNSLFFTYQLTCLRNFELRSLLLLSPLLLVLQLCFWAAALKDGLRSVKMLLSSQLWIVMHFDRIMKMRGKIQHARIISDSKLFPQMSSTLKVTNNPVVQAAFDFLCRAYYQIFRVSQAAFSSN